MVALGEIADWGSGGTPSRKNSSYFGSGTPWLSIADLNDGLISYAKESLTPAGLAASSAKVVPPGTVLVAMYGSIGKLGVATRELCTSQAIAFAKPKRHLVTTEYLFHALLAFRHQLVQLGRGGTQSNIGQRDLKRLEIPFPPLDEQRRIAAILDQAAKIRDMRRSSIHTAGRIRHGLVEELLRDSWPQARLGDVAATSSGGTPDRSNSSYYQGDIPWVKSGELHSGLITKTEETISAAALAESSAKLRPRGTVLVAMYGATAGVVGQLGIEAATNQAVCSINPGDDLDPTYLIEVLRFLTEHLLTLRSGGAQPNLSQKTLRSLEIPLPPMRKQLQFAESVAAIESRESDLVRSAGMIDSLYTCLQSRAFRGEL